MDFFKKAMPNTDDIAHFINEYLIVKKSQYYGKEEKDVQNVIVKQLRNEFGVTNVHSQYNVGGFLGLKCDIDLFDSKCCGIELKLAKQIAGNKNSAYERLIGQVVYYSKRCYDDKLIVLVIGTSKEYDTTLKEVQNFIESLGVRFIFKEVSI